MSVFLTVLVTQQVPAPGAFTVGHAATLFAEEMGGGALLGVGGGYLLLLVLRLEVETAIYPVLALMGALLVFGAAQSVGASGFIAVYLAGVIVGATEHRTAPAVEHFFAAVGWLAQIVLFLMLGLLLTPSTILSIPWLPLLATTATLLLIARPTALHDLLATLRLHLARDRVHLMGGLEGRRADFF